MGTGRLLQDGDLSQPGGPWKPAWREEGSAVHLPDRRNRRDLFLEEPANRGTTQIADESLRASPEAIHFDQYQSEPILSPEMTVAEFVTLKFAPEHVAVKRSAGRTHYQAILKHVLTPEEVDRVFHGGGDGSKGKLKANPDWPYISNVKLRDAHSDHVQRLIQAAVESGYSTQTVMHIRNVVSAIFSHAIREKCFTGGNPASQVSLPGMRRKETHSLTLAQAKQVIEAMQYPEKEMTLIAILTSMNMAEICGLQWKYVNLADRVLAHEGEVIPPRSIAIRKQWSRGELFNVAQSRNRNLPIPQLLFPVLLRLSNRARVTGWSDFVFISKAGTPINQMNIAARRLKSIGRKLQMPWLSWQVFRRTRATLVYEFGMQFQHQMATVVHSHPQQPPTASKGYETEMR